MNSRERVLTALSCEIPDKIPYCELGIDEKVIRRVITDGRSLLEKDLYNYFRCDNVNCLRFGPPTFGRWEKSESVEFFYVGGCI